MAKFNMEMNVDNFIKALAIQAEIDGMNAENKMREMNGDSMAYWSSDFDMKAEELRALLVDEKPEKVEIKHNIMCTCAQTGILHPLGIDSCLAKIANPQPKCCASIEGMSIDSDIFELYNKRYSRVDLMERSYQELKHKDGYIWTCLKSKEIKE